MTEYLLLLNNYLAIGVLVFEIFTAVLLMDLLWSKFGGGRGDLGGGRKFLASSFPKIFAPIDFCTFGLAGKFFSKNFAIYFIFFISLASSILTLVYSEIFGVVPCALCWFERIFMYGIVFMSANSIWRKEEEFIKNYILKFSIIGAAISLYHHILQMTAGSEGHLPCPTSGGDCAHRIIFEFGHITFPWMAFVMFVFFITYLKYTEK